MTIELTNEQLVGQIQGLLEVLARKDATEAECYKRLEAQYLAGFEQMKAMHERERERFKAIEKELRRDALRYQFLRKQLVGQPASFRRVWRLKIDARGDALDREVDKHIAILDARTLQNPFSPPAPAA